MQSVGRFVQHIARRHFDGPPAHRQAAAEFGLRAVPSLPALAAALVTGLPGDVADGGLLWGALGLPRRAAALLGQWLGGREGQRERPR